MNLKSDMLKDPILKSMMIFSIPILISLVFQNLYHMVDIAIVGNFLGTASLSAIGATSSLYNLLMSFSNGLGNGICIVFGRSYGSGDHNEVKKGVASSIIIGTVLSLCFVLLTFTGLKPMMRLLNTPIEVFEESYSYVGFIVLFAGITFFYNLLSAAFRAVGNSTTPLVVLVISSVLNVILDFIFVAALHMGVRGTAIATVTAQLVSVIICIVYIVKYEKILIPELRHFVPDFSLYKELLGQGISMAMMMTIVNCGSFALQSAINSLGSLTISAYVTARNIYSFAMMPLNAIASACATFTSQNMGAKQYRRVLEGVRLVNISTFVINCLAIVFVFLAAKWFVMKVSGSDDAMLIDYAVRYLKFGVCFYPILGLLCNYRNALQGCGKKIVPLISSFIELFAKFGFTFLIIPRIGYTGVVIAEPLIWVVMTIQLAASYNSQKKELKQLLS